MQRDVAIGKALCLPSIVKRIVPDRSAIDGDKNIFTFRSANKAHMIAKPAFKTAALVIIGTRTLALIVITTLETVNVEITHICSDFFKVFDKLTV